MSLEWRVMAILRRHFSAIYIFSDRKWRLCGISEDSGVSEVFCTGG